MTDEGKLTKKKVRYRISMSGSRERCGNCVMFSSTAPSMSLGSCSLVAGEIDSGAVCDRWEPK